MVAAPEGVKKSQDAHPDIDIYTASLDEKLNENGYIVPGLGDAGDCPLAIKYIQKAASFCLCLYYAENNRLENLK